MVESFEFCGLSIDLTEGDTKSQTKNFEKLIFDIENKRIYHKNEAYI